MSLVNTRIQELRVQSPNLDKWTNRPSRYGALDVFLTGNNEGDSIISPELLAKARAAVGVDVKVPVFDSETVSIGSTRSATIADSENTSQFYTVSFTTYAWGFTVIPSRHMNNEISVQKDFNRKFLKYLYQFAADLDTACLTAMNTNKSQVFADDLGYTPASDVLVAPLADKDQIIGDLTPIMNANDYYGDYHIVGNPGLLSQVMQMSEHGLYNDQDKTIQFLDKNLKFSNRLTNGAGHQATGYIVNSGSVGVLYRHEREALLGTETPDGHAWEIDTLPMLGMPIDTYFYYGVGDYSAIQANGTDDMTRVVKEHYGFAIDVATVVAYNNDLANIASPIAKFAIADS